MGASGNGLNRAYRTGIKRHTDYEWDGEMYRVVPGQGEVVREIFSKYLSGASAYGIAKAGRLLHGV